MTQFNDIPTGPHFAILGQTSVYIPGDERSRTHPGHGYPASTEYYITYRAFTDRAEWECEIEHLAARGDSFRAIVVTPAKVTTSTSVTVNT
jgi:hypothetical protein